MELSAEDIKKHRAIIKLQRGYEISVFIAFAILCAYFFGLLDLDLMLILVGIELLALCIGFLVNPVSKVYGGLLSSVISSDKSNILTQREDQL